MTKGLIFSGIQPTGNLHLGNYLGAIKQWVNIQHDYDCIFSIVDMHAITVPQDPKELRENTIETAATYIACGIDPEKSLIYNQSAVSGHAELAWILACNTPLGWLNRMTQFKEKAGKQKENSMLALFAYPVLMAADILLYKATHVPVGEDQKQHLELAREIATSFNHRYNADHLGGDHLNGGYFPIPEPMILGEATRIMSLRDGKNKMSKSEESDMSRINLTDGADLILKKFKKAKTDMDFDGISYDIEKRPEISNLLTIYASLKDISTKEAEEHFRTYQNGKFKEEVATTTIEALSPISSEMIRLMNDKPYLIKILNDSAEKASEIAEKNIKNIKDIVGFLV